MAERLKERVYVTFTALAVVLALLSHEGPTDRPGRILLITVVATLLATFVADVVSHIAVHAVLPSRSELRHMLGVTLSALAGVALPLLFLALAAADVWDVDHALRAASIALIAALAVIAYVAVRRVRLPRWQKLIVLLAEFLLGCLVVGVELLAHG